MTSVIETMQVLVVDDEPSIRRLIEKELGSDRRRITAVGTAAEARQAFSQEAFDLVLLDMQLPDGRGMELLAHFQDLAPEVQVIIITGFGEVDDAVQAMKLGAYDYITKPYALDRLTLVMEKAYQRTCLQRENRLLRRAQSDRMTPKLVGQSGALENIRYLIRKVAPTQVPVLITGESGTGKNVVSRSIHHLSQRSGFPLITKNCGTLQKELILSELFGHRKGAFTGAAESRDGLLALAHKGTLFLDEIGELPMDVQASLLRVLESQTYRQVGGQDERRVDIRFIFATNRNLTDEVEAGRFSQALYHRINVFNIELEPLRERKEDIPLLVDHFRKKMSRESPPCQMSKRAMQCLMAYDWPGNIRELKNVIEHGVITCTGNILHEEHLLDQVKTVKNAKLLDNQQHRLTAKRQDELPDFREAKKEIIANFEYNYFSQLLELNDWNIAKSARSIGMHRSSLQRLLRKYGLNKSPE
mgnify:CR=1 FL=1